MLKIPVGLLLAHAAALVFGLAGMLIALPNPQLWSGSPLGVQTFQFGMQYAGSLHIVLGAATMFAFGAATLGWRKTAIFFIAACTLSLGSELIGTGTGWPFGNYEYTDGLGLKVLGRVPYSIPLSWFYMGLASYLLGVGLARALSVRPAWAWSLALGATLMVVWDLVLDPAMAHPSLPLQFWVWRLEGPYFGMPAQNFAGWWVTALAFMAVSRWAWRAEPATAAWRSPIPLAVYALNTAFGMVLSGYAGLWVPIALAGLLGLAPAALGWRRAAASPPAGRAVAVRTSAAQP